jgi:hypothetical protein
MRHGRHAAPMTRKITFAFAAATALLASPALADWANTRWGDSVEKVIAAVGDGAILDRGNKDDRIFDKDRLASSEGDYNGIKAVRQFFFDGKGGLAVVKIKPKDYTDCDQFMVAAKGELGELEGPRVKELSTFKFSSWIRADRKANQAIMLVQVNNLSSGRQICHVTYQPYGSGKPGLEN